MKSRIASNAARELQIWAFLLAMILAPSGMPSFAVECSGPVEVRLQCRGSGTDRNVEFSRDGSRVIAAASDDTVSVFDAARGTCLQVLEPRGGQVTAVALSGDGAIAAVGSYDASLTIWDVATGRQRQRFVMPETEAKRRAPESRTCGLLIPPSHPAWTIAFSPDGREVLAVSSVAAAAWEVATGRLDRKIESLGFTTARMFDSSAKHLLVGNLEDEKSFVTVIRTKDFGRLTQLPEHDSEILALAASDDSRTVAIGDEKRLVLRDLASGRIVAQMPVRCGHERLRLSADGRIVFAVTDFAGWRLWKVGSTRFEEPVADPERGLIGAGALSRDGRFVATVADVRTGTFGVWDVTRRDWCWQRSRVLAVPGCFAVARTCSVAHALLDGKTAMSWDLVSWDGPRHSTVDPNSDESNPTSESMATSGDGRESLVLSRTNGAFRLVAEEGVALGTKRFGMNQRNASVVGIDPSGTRRALGLYDGSIELHLPTGRTLTIPSPEIDQARRFVRSIAFDPSGKWLVAGWDGKAYLYSTDRATRTLKFQFDDPGDVNCLALDDAREVLIAGTDSCHLSAWSPATGKKLRTIDLPGLRVRKIALSEDARTVAVGTEWGGMHLCDVATGRVLRTVPAHAHHIVGLGFESGKRLWTAGADGFVKVWTADATRELARIAFLKDGGWIAQTPDGRFDGSPGCEKHVAFVETGTLRVRTEDGLAARFRRRGLLKELLKDDVRP